MRLFEHDGTHYQEWRKLHEMARDYFGIPGVVKQSEHYLRSGGRGSKYVDFDVIISDPVRCGQVTRLFAAQIEEVMSNKAIDFLGFLDKGGEGTVGAIALAGALEMLVSLPSVYVRPWKDVRMERIKASRDKEIYSLSDASGILVTDHCTTGGEALRAVRLLREAGAHMEDVVAYSYHTEDFEPESFVNESIEFYSMYECPEDLVRAGVDLGNGQEDGTD